MTDAYIVGVDMIKFGRFPDKTVPQLGAEAALMALDDCGLQIQDMEALYCGNLGQASAMVGQRVLQEIGQTGIPVVNVSNACATGATAFREAWASVKAGLYDCVLAVGVEQMGKGLLGGAGGKNGHTKKRACWVLAPCLLYLLRQEWSMRENMEPPSSSLRRSLLKTITTQL